MIGKIAQALEIDSSRRAFHIDGEDYTYESLAQRIVAIMEQIDRYAAESDCIGVVERDDIETYASILAVMMSGRAYVILNPMNPLQRNRTIVNTTGMSMVLYSHRDNLVVDISASVTCISSLGLKGDASRLRVKEVDETSLAYIIFTSGSTGTPKGVPISRANLNTFYEAYSDLGFDLGKEDRMLQMFDLCFDVSVVSTLYPLTLGACVYTVAQDGVKYTQVYELLEDEDLTFAAMPPSLLSYLQPYFSEINLPHLKYLVVTAEASSWNLISQFMLSIPNANVVNLYGPTEGTIYCMACVVDPQKVKQYNGMLAIGQAFKGIDLMIVDEDLKPVPEGTKGELCIAGDQIMSGYWRDQQKSDEVFFEYESTRYYRTGDLCMMDLEGCVLYCGRIDYQVQIQGFRVELSECEHAVRKYHSSGNSVVVPFANSLGNQELHLFVEKLLGGLDQLQDFLRQNLPPYMCPKRVHVLDALPLNTSGKVDRKKLLTLIK